MANPEHLQFLQFHTPTLWSLLNSTAQSTLPPGIADFIGTGDPEALAEGKAWLVTAEQHLNALISLCGKTDVLASYRRDLSGTFTAAQLAELLCELTLCASLAGLSSQKPQLRPPSGRGTSCDVAVQLAGHTVYCEVKRYADPWPNDQGVTSRSLFKSLSNAGPQEARRPRYMDLQSKLKGVPKQFPQRTINILFVFHPSQTPSANYIQQSLFGEATFFMEPTEVVLQEDGLFMKDDWRDVSACYLSQVRWPDRHFVCINSWQNPNASTPIPPAAQELLNSLHYPFMFEEQRDL
jgi:hypothetical protein